MTFAQLLGSSRSLNSLAERSVWLARAGRRQFYCSLKFRVGCSVGWRYDRDCMCPVNGSAVELDRILRPLVAEEQAESVVWRDDMAIVLSNWTVLHGRGPEPKEEGTRIIERLYVR
jgi:hypothetical protein